MLSAPVFCSDYTKAGNCSAVCSPASASPLLLYPIQPALPALNHSSPHSLSGANSGLTKSWIREYETLELRSRNKPPSPTRLQPTPHQTERPDPPDLPGIAPADYAPAAATARSGAIRCPQSFTMRR